MTGGALVAAMCAAHVLTMLGVFAFPALLPTFVQAWQLSNTEAGWIAGVYFGAYAVGVSVLVALTDRYDARLVYVGGAVLGALAAAGFALFAAGFWTAAVLRGLAGLALAATYMPGLRVLVDRYRGRNQSRAIALYTASFSLGTAASFLFAGEMAAAFGWRWAFAAAALGAAVAAVIVLVLRPVHRERHHHAGELLNFRPVLANRPAMGFILGYGVHCWELFTMRSWLVAFLAFSLAQQPGGSTDAAAGGIGLPAPTTVAMVSGLVAMAASVGGNELCVRFGRRRVIRLVMGASVVFAGGIGFAAAGLYIWVAVLALAYSAVVQLDSAALTAGAVAAAEPKRQGATMAVHSLIGFGGGFIGPLVLGAVLDMAGGAATAVSWGLAFATIAVVGLLGPVVMGLVPPDHQ